MDKKDVLKLIKEYNQTLSKNKLSELERHLVDDIEDKPYFYNFTIYNIALPKNVETFLKDQHYFRNLLPDDYERLCLYLNHFHEYTCNHDVIRMNARSQNFSYYKTKVIRVIGAFYLFYGAKLNMKKFIYGEYGNLFGGVDFAPVIASELLSNNQEVIQYCKDVLMSENNIAILTRNVIVAIEQSQQQEFQDLLTQIFLNAKLQEGLRQAVIETADEGQIDYFLKIVEVVEKENLIRFSSVQRGILTWIGIGYEIAEEKQIKFIFSKLCEYLRDDKQRIAGLNEENPLCVYLALYCKGIYEVDDAIEEAVHLLEHSKRHIVASALIYLKMTNHFDVFKYDDFMEKYKNDEWIMALYISELTRLEWDKLDIEPIKVYPFFETLLRFVSHMKAQQNYFSKGFEWFSLQMYKGFLVNRLFLMIKKYPDVKMIEALLPFISIYLSSKELPSFMENYFPKLNQDVKKTFMLKEIISANEQLGKYIVQEYLKMDLSEQDILGLEDRLKTKKGHARALIIQVLSLQNEDSIHKSYERLSASSSKVVQESAQELKRKVPDLFENDDEIIVKGSEEGFGMYTPHTMITLPYPTHLKYNEKGLLKKKKILDLSFLQVMNKQEVLDYIALWNQRIQAHAHDEYKVYGEYRQIGNSYGFFPLDYSQRSLDALPLADVWRNYFNQDHLSSDAIFQLRFYISAMGVYLSRCFASDIDIFEISREDVQAFEYFEHYCKIMRYYFYEFENEESYKEKAASLIEMFNTLCTVDTFTQLEGYNQKEEVTYAFSSLDCYGFLVECLKLEKVNDEEFKKYFPLVYEGYNIFHMKLDTGVQNKFQLSPFIFARAVLLGMIPESILLENVLDTHTKNDRQGYYYRSQKCRLSTYYQIAYFEGKSMYRKPVFTLPEKNKAECDYLRDVLDKIAETLLKMESTRINEETLVTEYVKELRVVRGMKHFIEAMHAIENEELKRQTYGNERSVVFGKVIRNCYPVNGDEAKMLKKENFPEKRLVEVAMMAPQWIDIIAEVLGWVGFKETCYYFIAHMKQYEKDQKKAEIAHYTELDPDDLNDGAFDHVWCQKVSEMLGEKRMKIVYQAAKFLCENSFHTRARKYADACLGKVNKEEYLKQAKEKRNKDALNAYCICPLVGEQDLLERYQYVQLFLKESKKFGTQRQASEKRACEIAFMNLARNSKYETVTRLSWIMESEMIKQYAYALTPQTIDDIEVWIEIDEYGKNEIKVRKNNRSLKSIPAKLKNNEIIIELKNIHAMWNEQYKRSRHMLETAMEERTCLNYEEIKVIMNNPIVSPLLSKLVLYSGGNFGYFKDGRLQGIDGTVDFVGDVRIAHPYDLYTHNVWHDYQKDIFTKQLVQPFKQVFRELYTKLEDELEHSSTKRYTGYQIQPKKAAGALKSRRWNVSYENGLERVYYKENMIVNLYADADWFSPSDIEAPSIDYVSFTSRNNNKPILIKDIDDVVFSETMRDVDLAVSVAYVGGVDPLTTFSTMELRRTIVECACELMKLENVKVQDHFVNIQGTYNDYSIHLGSGMIHQNGGSAIHVVPIYSGKRGKVYLPFLDEDPMTAQIVTKVIMFAEDNKIKDPSILQQIVLRKDR